MRPMRISNPRWVSRPGCRDADCCGVSQRFEKHARNVTVLTFLSRITGLVRDAAMSRCFGAGLVMDSFAFAFMIPNLFRRLFGEGALSAAFIPVYTRLERDDPALARRTASTLVGIMVLVLGGLTAIGEIALGALQLRTGGDHLGLRLMAIMLPYMPLVCLVAILGAMLQVRGRFGPTASAPVILNLFIVGAAVFFRDRPDDTHVSLTAWAVIVAGLVQVVWSVLGAGHAIAWPRLRDPEALRELRGVFSQTIPMVLGLGVLQLNTFLDGLIASYPSAIGSTILGFSYPLDEGAMASLGYAQRLYEFPLGVFGIAVATAIFPQLSRQANEPDAFVDTLRRGLRLVLFIGLPASVGLMLVRDQITAVILQGGDFRPEDTARVGRILMGYAPAIWAYSMTHTLTRGFYARGDSKTPVRVSLGMVALNLTLNLTLIWTPLREAGLAWSTATCAIIQSCILTRLLHRRVGIIVDGAVRSAWGRTVVATIAMAACVLLVSWLMEGDGWREAVRRLVDANGYASLGGWAVRIVELGAMVAAGGIGTFGASMILRMPEIRWALGRG